MDYTNTPLVIGATGGWGTSIVTRICQQAGFYMGSNFNKFFDAQDFLPFYDKWVHTMLSSKRSALNDDDNKKMYDDDTRAGFAGTFLMDKEDNKFRKKEGGAFSNQ